MKTFASLRNYSKHKKKYIEIKMFSVHKINFSKVKYDTLNNYIFSQIHIEKCVVFQKFKLRELVLLHVYYFTHEQI